MNPNYEKVFTDKRMQPSVPDHQQRIVDFLRFYASADCYEDLYNHYAPGLAENGIHVGKVDKHDALVTVDKDKEEEETKIVEKPKEKEVKTPAKKRGRPKSSPSK